MKLLTNDLRWFFFGLAIIISGLCQTVNSNVSNIGPIVDFNSSKVVKQLDASTLVRLGKAANLAEAAPLLKELTDSKEAHFQARRAAKLEMKGKSDTERLKIWATMQAAERKRVERLAELKFKVSEIQKQEWETQRAAVNGKAPGRS